MGAPSSSLHSCRSLRFPLSSSSSTTATGEKALPRSPAPVPVLPTRTRSSPQLAASASQPRGSAPPARSRNSTWPSSQASCPAFVLPFPASSSLASASSSPFPSHPSFSSSCFARCLASVNQTPDPETVSSAPASNQTGHIFHHSACSFLHHRRRRQGFCHVGNKSTVKGVKVGKK